MALDDSFATIYNDICYRAAQALHWFDIAAFYQEAHRVLKANGTVAVIGYGEKCLEHGDGFASSSTSIYVPAGNGAHFCRISLFGGFTFLFRERTAARHVACI